MNKKLIELEQEQSKELAETYKKPIELEQEKRNKGKYWLTCVSSRLNTDSDVFHKG